jgi:hypothetical protein
MVATHESYGERAKIGAVRVRLMQRRVRVTVSTARSASVARRLRLRLGVLFAAAGLVAGAVAAPATAAPTTKASSAHELVVAHAAPSDWWL